MDDRYDFNRDKLVNATDQIIARNNRTSPFTALKLITPPLESGGGEGEGEGEAPGFRLQAPGSNLKPDTWSLKPEPSCHCSTHPCSNSQQLCPTQRPTNIQQAA